jgi:hypothetical protein
MPRDANMASFLEVATAVLAMRTKVGPGLIAPIKIAPEIIRDVSKISI